jgi:hypothetical protein
VYTLPRKDTSYLQAFDTLISAGLLSRRISIVNATVSFWNETFGTEDGLEYSPQVVKALRKLQPTVELQLSSPLPPNRDVSCSFQNIVVVVAKSSRRLVLLFQFKARMMRLRAKFLQQKARGYSSLPKGVFLLSGCLLLQHSSRSTPRLVLKSRARAHHFEDGR